MASTFEKETQVMPLGEDTYEVVLDPSWQVMRGPNGGYVAATLVRALRHAFPEAGRLVDLDVTFLDPASPGPAQISTSGLRTGGSVDVARARLSQGGEPSVIARATLGRASEGPRFVAEAPPDVPSFEEGQPLPDQGDLEPPTFTQHCEYRIVGGDPPLAGQVGGDMRVWMRLAEPTAYDEPLVVFLADAWMAAIYSVLDEPLPAPSLDFSLQVFQVPETLDASDPLLGVFRAEAASDGFAFEDGTLWTPDGELVARARQTRRVFEPATSR